MRHVNGQIIIDRPVDEVFDFVADERNEPRYNPQMRYAEQTSAGPIGVGTTFRAESTSRGRPVMMTIAFTEYQRPRRLTSATHLSTMDIQGTLTFDPVPEGTRMRWSWDLQPQGMLKLMTPVIALIGRRQERTIWTGLKRYLEAREAPLAADRVVKPS
jgi:polyketide cyclase/dehydrase/lipid transport protein